jgi:predicted PurR-regulated permease PerM
VTAEPEVRVSQSTIERAVRLSRLSLPKPVFGERGIPLGTLEMPRPEAPAPWTASSLALVVLASLAAFYTLYVARPVLLPIILALLMGFLLRPLVRGLRRIGLREPIGAAIVVLGFTVTVSTAGVLLLGPATSWIERAPTVLADVEKRFASLTRQVLKLEATAARVEAIASGTSAAPARTAPAPSARTPFLRRAAGSVAGFFAMAVSVVFLTYFLLASGDLFVRKLTRVLSGTGDIDLPREISNQIEASVSKYLVTVALINTALALATWGVLQLVGMPNAGLWGTVAGCLNVIPYVGAMITAAILTVAAVASLDTLQHALVVPAVFLALNLIESNVITPTLMGKQFPLNPVALFIGVMFWGFIWGVAGAILAVPMMVTLKILCDQIPALQPIAEFLGQ